MKTIIILIITMAFMISCGSEEIPSVQNITSPTLPTLPTTYYINNGNDTFTEKSSGLMWTRYPTINNYKTWDEAMAYAANSTHAGYTDWRLPTPNELINMSLSGYAMSAQDLRAEGFEIYNVGMYWTNAQVNTTNAYAVQLGYRHETMPANWTKTAQFYAWIVR